MKARILRFAPPAQRFVEEVHPPLKDRLRAAVLALAGDPLSGKPLRGDLKGHYSYRVGDWRVIYSFDRESVYIESIRHRRDAYRRT
ncbi:MAG: type II toxin-antitoxin system RelE/ParE family toxin [Acidobacteriota bacterium]